MKPINPRRLPPFVGRSLSGHCDSCSADIGDLCAPDCPARRPTVSQYDPAEHIFEWARNSAEHYSRMEGLAKYPRDASFVTAAAGMAFTLATETYRAMLKGNEIDRNEVSPVSILAAAKRFLEFQTEE